jgi:hypothetical protein
MKRVLYIWIALICGFSQAFSQSSQTSADKITRNVLTRIDANEVVKPGEFQMELQKGMLFNELTDNPWFNFIFTTCNKYTGNGNVMVNSRPRFINQEIGVRTYRIGPTLENSIFVIKNTGESNNSMGKGMEVVLAYGFSNPICDSVMYINDDGFVYSLNDKCYYCQYNGLYDNQPHREQVVWLQRKHYEPDLKFDDPYKTEALARLAPGDVYFESYEGHYYYLYRDDYMPNTVMVVDNVPVELFGVYNGENLKFKFSYNGKHWMAVGRECFWVDGELKSVEGYEITCFEITNDGHYCYTAFEKSSSKKNMVVVYDGHVIRRNAEVCYFGLNSQGALKIRFVSGDRFLQYENDKVIDVTNLMASIYYPGSEKDRVVQVVSPNGEHKLTYRRGVPSVEIDGVKVADSEPCYAIFDERNNAFVWNAIESFDMKTELVIYRYPVVNKIFKNFFK